MARFTFGDQDLEIPKFKLREIKAAAPFIDRVIARRKKLAGLGEGGITDAEMAERLSELGSPMETMVDTLSDIVRIIAVGVLHAKGERPYSVASIEAQAELIEDEIGTEDFSTLNGVFDDIAREAGMLRAVPTKAPEGAEEETARPESE